jgi:hypothetical protein
MHLLKGEKITTGRKQLYLVTRKTILATLHTWVASSVGAVEGKISRRKES